MTTTPLIKALTSQYEAALEMLRAAIQASPGEVWDSADYENRTWRIAYHTLHCTKMYLASSLETFSIWDGVIEGAESLGGSWEDPSKTIVVEGVHSTDELLAFLESLLTELPKAIAAVPLEAESGFDWYPFSRLELHLNNIRHIQHHTGQIIERLRSQGVTGIEWLSGAGTVEW
ncbi:MAG: DinB family protein [Rhodothermaceae bacterium]|nr:DinB family protein [Rhodothermaceae bacterium]